MARPAPPFSHRADPPPSAQPTRALDTKAPHRVPQLAAESLLGSISLPQLVFDPDLRLYSLNQAACSVLGAPPASLPTKKGDGHASMADAGDAGDFVWASGADLRDGLELLADREEARLSGAAFSPAEWSWSEGDRLELRGGQASSARWSAEVKVTRFFPPRLATTGGAGAADTDAARAPGRPWFAILVLGPWREPARAVRDLDAFPDPALPSSPLPSSNTSSFPRKGSYNPADLTPTLGSSSSVTNPFGRSAIAERRASASALAAANMTPQPGDNASWEYAQPFGAATINEDAEVGAHELAGEAPTNAGVQDRRRSISGVPPDSAEWPGVARPAFGTSPTKTGLRIPHVALAAASAISPRTAAGQHGSGGSSGSGSANSAGSGASLLSTATATTARTSPSSRDGIRSSGPAPPVSLPEALKGMGIAVSSAGIQLTQSSPIIVPASETPSSSSSTSTVSTTHTSTALTTPTTPGDGLTPTAQNPGVIPLHLPMPRTRQPHPLSISRSSPSTSSSNSSPAMSPSNPPPLLSPRPTALPPIPDRPPPVKPDQPAILKFAALASLPNTGIIIADSDLMSGYVNALARELLMGVPATDGEAHDGEWWTQGQWSVDEEPWSSASGATQASSTSQAFFSPNADLRANPFDAKDLTYQAIIASGEAKPVDSGTGTAGSNIRIGHARETNRYRATVAGILARSLVTDERRKAALGKGGPAGPPSSGSTSASASSSDFAAARRFTETRSPGAQSTASSGSGSSTAGQVPGFVAAGGLVGPNRKPYKIYDETFSQRIIDPFEPLLEMTARKGEQPPQLDPDADEEEEILAGQVANGMVIGVEVEVWDAPTAGAAPTVSPSSSLKQDSFTMTASAQLLGNRKKRVRRRIIEVSSAPIYAPGHGGKKQHLGGMLIVRDVTVERKRESSSGNRLSRKKSVAEGYYKQILDSIPQLIWRTTPGGSHNYFNASWVRRCVLSCFLRRLQLLTVHALSQYLYTGEEPETSLGLGWQSPFHEGACFLQLPLAVLTDNLPQTTCPPQRRPGRTRSRRESLTTSSTAAGDTMVSGGGTSAAPSRTATPTARSRAGSAPAPTSTSCTTCVSCPHQSSTVLATRPRRLCSLGNVHAKASLRSLFCRARVGAER